MKKSKIKEFIKKHKGKFIIGGLVITNIGLLALANYKCKRFPGYMMRVHTDTQEVDFYNVDGSPLSPELNEALKVLMGNAMIYNVIDLLTNAGSNEYIEADKEEIDNAIKLLRKAMSGIREEMENAE